MQNTVLLSSYCLLLLFTAWPGSATRALVGQVSHGSNSDLYMLKLPIGTPPQTQSLIFDVESQITKVNCGKGGFISKRSSTFRERLEKCPTPVPETCGRIAEDSVTLNTTDGTRPLKPYTVAPIDFKCVLNRKGSAALSAGSHALPSLLYSHGHLTSRSFAYCLPAVSAFPGPVFFGHLPTYTFQSGPAINISGVLASTSLSISNLKGTFSISLQSILVNGRTNIKTPTTPLYMSTVQPYTKLERSLYRSLRSVFRQAIGYGNVTKAKPAVVPFDTCFDSSHFSSTRVGPSVPSIELHLKGGAIWSIFGDNSVVSMDDGRVLCLAFVDAGVGRPSVLGNFQQRDNFLEYDLTRSILRFSGPLAFFRTLCPNFLF